MESSRLESQRTKTVLQTLGRDFPPMIKVMVRAAGALMEDFMEVAVEEVILGTEMVAEVAGVDVGEVDRAEIRKNVQ